MDAKWSVDCCLKRSWRELRVSEKGNEIIGDVGHPEPEHRCFGIDRGANDINNLATRLTWVCYRSAERHGRHVLTEGLDRVDSIRSSFTISCGSLVSSRLVVAVLTATHWAEPSARYSADRVTIETRVSATT